MFNKSPSTPKAARSRQARPLRWLGYAVAILVNAVVLLVVNRFPGWEILPFLTPDFSRVLWLFNLSVVASILVNGLFFIYDPEWFMALCRVGLNSIALTFAVRLLRIFPFDFSRWRGFNWELLARVILIIAIVGTSVAILVEFIKFVVAFIRQR